MSLTKILEEIKVNQAFADASLENEPRETYTARAGRKQRALESLKDLKGQYRTELRKNTMFIVVVGANKDAFTSTATENFGLFSADPTELYNDVAARINPALYQGNFSTQDVFEILGRYLEDKAMELGVVEYPQPIFRQEYRRNITSKQDVVQLITDVINGQVGSELAGLQALYSITNKAVERNHDSKTTPILLATDNEKLALDLLSGLPRLTKSVYLVVAGKASKTLKNVPGSLYVKEVDKESVEQTLTNIKNLNKK